MVHLRIIYTMYHYIYIYYTNIKPLCRVHERICVCIYRENTFYKDTMQSTWENLCLAQPFSLCVCTYMHREHILQRTHALRSLSTSVSNSACSPCSLQSSFWLCCNIAIFVLRPCISASRSPRSRRRSASPTAASCRTLSWMHRPNIHSPLVRHIYIYMYIYIIIIYYIF